MKIHFIWNSQLNLKSIIPEIKNYIKKVHVCSLCNIAYNGLRQKIEWKNLMKKLKIEGYVSRTHFSNLISKDMQRVSQSNFPCVLIEQEGEFSLLLTQEEINSCFGDIDKFEKMLVDRLS